MTDDELAAIKKRYADDWTKVSQMPGPEREAHADRTALLIEVERLREEVERLSDLIYESIPKWQARDLLRERDEARADAAALREMLIDARDKVEWIGCSPEGQQEMNRMRDDCLCRIDAVLARAALKGER